MLLFSILPCSFFPLILASGKVWEKPKKRTKYEPQNKICRILIVENKGGLKETLFHGSHLFQSCQKCLWLFWTAVSCYLAAGTKRS